MAEKTSSLTKQELASLIQWAYYTEIGVVPSENSYAKKLMSLPKPVLQRAGYFAACGLATSNEEAEYDYKSMKDCISCFKAYGDKKEYVATLNVPQEFMSSFYGLPSWLFRFVEA